MKKLKYRLYPLAICLFLAISAPVPNVWALIGTDYLVFKKTEKQAVQDTLTQIVVKEASSQNNLGMVAVAWCMKNRMDAGMDYGVGKLSNPKIQARMAEESKRTWARAKDAVTKVLNQEIYDVTNGAVFYENVRAFGVPDYIKKGLSDGTIEQCAEIGDHVFWRYKK